MGVNTHQEPVVYMRQDCHVAISEGFFAHTRVEVSVADKSVVATLVLVSNELLSHQQAGLSEAAWHRLGCPEEGSKATFRHAHPVDSMSFVRGKLYGQAFTDESAAAIVRDINNGLYSDIQLSAYVTACAGDRLSLDETIAITRAMVAAGQQFDWHSDVVLDKHCVG
ncbi:MAG: thymidine phosphorylase, partial [Oleibacter sp.]|nr:thymidine phosphorylase [Thalassolituus sp.]